MSNNPFTKQRKGWDMDTKSPLDFATAAVGVPKGVQARREEEKTQGGTDIYNLPRHLFVPAGARSLDIRNLAELLPGEVYTLLEFTAPEGTTCFFYGYGIFNDALDFSLVEFLPTVDDRRVFPYHGNPQANYKIALGLGPDLGNNSLFSCQLQVDPGQTLKFVAINNDVVNVVMGARMVGYIDNATSRPTRVFGG